MEPLYDIDQVGPPITFQLSFQPFVDYLNDQRNEAPSTALAQFYSYLIDQFTPVSLSDRPTDLLDADQLKELFQLATVAVLPLTGSSQNIPFAFGLPQPLTMYYQSNAFSDLAQQFPDLLVGLRDHAKTTNKQLLIYQLILEKIYGIRTTKQAVLSVDFQRDVNGLTRSYRMDVNLSFMNVRANGVVPPLQRAWVDFANGITKMPPVADPLVVSDFIFEGFAFFRIEDITEAQTIQQLQEVFAHLQSDTEAAIYQRFEKALRNLCGEPDLQISIVPLPQVNGLFVDHPELRSRSVFLRHSSSNFRGAISDTTAQQKIQNFIQHSIPILFPDLDGIPEPERALLHQKGIRSFLMYPITTTNEVLGILEMGSRHRNALNEEVLTKIERIMPLIQELLRYQLRQFHDTLEGLIKKQFTSLQPAVEWKFYEVAWEALRSRQNLAATGSSMRVEFSQVYPYYGAIDIRDSSIERHKAVRQDLLDQLTAVNELFSQMPLPADTDHFNRILTQCQRWQTKLAASLNFNDEQNITDFLVQELHPFLRQLLPYEEEWGVSLQQYFNRTDPQTGQFNYALNVYERSMNWINATINDYINQEEKKLQAIYPHYLERYRTDGMEYTVYVGQSIAPMQPFDQDYRRRLSEWQLTSMVEMAQLTHRLVPLLPLPLQTTQLILVHTHPVNIAFRQDERRFDVEGSYSIRYEVLKKRIDKAYIDGTRERLTQPDTIAVVYSHSMELTDYLPFIAELQERGLLQPDMEYLDIEPLQGVSNLKALRLHIKYDAVA
ncbi:GAF domain-containing protein [Spirosoma radiotolerans]|uniref:GAF domain-containing protein n=1 Tax=Spirosoma radiotolerans TaxID=1379870 RepID=A0A0E3V8K7_9BACT|nr:GAF domain-containing protein [Spirosoma radiotolerans]AKD56837.1 hypothetical protein SD10_19945 [Spirosoma radiotolerans]